jgi:hypothetical protein
MSAICCVSSVEHGTQVAYAPIVSKYPALTMFKALFKARWIEQAYRRFLELPIVVVLVVLWLAGVAVLGIFVLAIYLYGSALMRMLLGP